MGQIAVILGVGDDAIFKAYNLGCKFGYYLAYDGTESAEANYVISPFIEIIGGHEINFRPSAQGWGAYLIEFDSSKTKVDHWGILGDLYSGRTITTHNNCKYVRFSCPILYLNLFRIKDTTDDVILFEI